MYCWPWTRGCNSTFSTNLPEAISDRGAPWKSLSNVMYGNGLDNSLQ